MIGSKKTTFTEDVKHATAQPPPLGPLLEEVAGNFVVWGSTLFPLHSSRRQVDMLINSTMTECHTMLEMPQK